MKKYCQKFEKAFIGHFISWSVYFITQDCYTRVLKGHIDIASAVFPNDTYGEDSFSLSHS